MSDSHLVLGGARSGKSRRALALCEGFAAPVFLATAEAHDAEMQARIERHRAERGSHWHLREEPLLLCERLLELASPGGAVLVDCLTLWLSNLMHQQLDAEIATRELCEMLPQLPGRIVLVSNELGLGLVPDTALGRAFRDAQGHLNQALAGVCEHVEFVVAGLPLALKGRPQGHRA
ncbi:MAG: bifunctional adenosylcobinamide kinase/adenosylcobinamide-phosphate guanylyltransferase [Gammaproteobacteria bacterium]|nr:bifunctional adenosylcobinamide kinase/adenosylcobinamide-phosphate guanylyltransferase [Gammaproteobacteria bacterium]